MHAAKPTDILDGGKVWKQKHTMRKVMRTWMKKRRISSNKRPVLGQPPPPIFEKITPPLFISIT